MENKENIEVCTEFDLLELEVSSESLSSPVKRSNDQTKQLRKLNRKSAKAVGTVGKLCEIEISQDPTNVRVELAV